jgi:hypothetical protein
MTGNIIPDGLSIAASLMTFGCPGQRFADFRWAGPSEFAHPFLITNAHVAILSCQVDDVAILNHLPTLYSKFPFLL